MFVGILIWLTITVAAAGIGLSLGGELGLRAAGFGLELLGIVLAIVDLARRQRLVEGVSWFDRFRRFLGRSASRVIQAQASTALKLESKEAFIDFEVDLNTPIKEQLEGIWKAIRAVRLSIKEAKDTLRQERDKAMQALLKQIERLQAQVEDLRTLMGDVSVGDPIGELLAIAWIITGVSLATFSPEIVGFFDQSDPAMSPPNQLLNAPHL